ncbi:MAG: flippase [Nanoarchaeota archaeon]|nr:flippase [Nanoarchaeota archaeon]MBU1005596.1 flippase [Nanoarchaeota archaeon]MBU1945982.1 flippase [Nanoarchaeota archaeon]
MSSARTIAKNAGFLFSTEIINKIISLVLVIIITRYLGSIGFGKYSFAFAFIGLVTMISHMGLTVYIFREIAKDKSKAESLVNNTLTLKFAITIVSYLISVLIALAWPKTNEILPVILLVMVHELFNAFNTLMGIVFKAFEKNQFVFYYTSIERIFSLGFSAYVLMTGNGIYTLLLALIASKLITSVYCYIVSYRKFVKLSLSFDYKMWHSLLTNSWPFWFTMIFQRIYYQISTVMLTAMKSYQATGWYNASSTLITALTFIPSVITHATFPAMSRFHHTDSKDYLKRLYKQSFYYLLVIGIPISIGVSLLANQIILWMYKEQFIESGKILAISSVVIVLIFLNENMGYLLNSINKQKLFTASTVICTTSAVILNIVLIPRFSYIGAAVATVITQIISFGILYYFTTKNNYPLNLIKISYKPIIAGIIMGALVIYIKFMPVIYIIPLAAMGYFAALFVMGGFGKEEIDVVKSFIPWSGQKK